MFSVILSKEFIIYIVSFRMVGIRLSQSLSMIANDWNLINILENWHLFTNEFLQKNNNNVYNDNRFFNWKLMVEVFFLCFYVWII